MDATNRDRQWAMGLLARAKTATLESLWRDWTQKPEFSWLRKPETGLVMVRGRMGGDAGPFNLGEMTVTRCTLQLATGTFGQACTQGRSHRKAELAALFDALFQEPETAERMRREVLVPLDEALETARNEQAGRSDATKVQFFTRVRGDN